MECTENPSTSVAHKRRQQHQKGEQWFQMSVWREFPRKTKNVSVGIKKTRHEGEQRVGFRPMLVRKRPENVKEDLGCSETRSKGEKTWFFSQDVTVRFKKQETLKKNIRSLWSFAYGSSDYDGWKTLSLILGRTAFWNERNPRNFTTFASRRRTIKDYGRKL